MALPLASPSTEAQKFFSGNKFYEPGFGIHGDIVASHTCTVDSLCSKASPCPELVSGLFQGLLKYLIKMFYQEMLNPPGGSRTQINK